MLRLSARAERVRLALAVIAVWSCVYPWAPEAPLEEQWQLEHCLPRDLVELEPPGSVHASAGFGVWRASIPLLGVCLLSACAISPRLTRHFGDHGGAGLGFGVSAGLTPAIALLCLWGSSLQRLATAEPWGMGAYAGAVALALFASFELVLVTMRLVWAQSRRWRSSPLERQR